MRWRAVLHTAETIRTGVPQAKVDYAAMPPDQVAAHYRGINAEAVAAARTLMARHDCSIRRHLVDVGGGSRRPRAHHQRTPVPSCRLRSLIWRR